MDERGTVLTLACLLIGVAASLSGVTSEVGAAALFGLAILILVGSRWEALADVTPFGMMPLDGAALRIYERLRAENHLWAHAAERLRSNSEPDGVLEYISAGILGEVPIYGKRAPSTKYELMKDISLNTGKLVDGGRTMILRDQHKTAVSDLAIKRKDFRRALNQMKDEG